MKNSRLFVLLLLIVSGCRVSDCICPEIYAPVCGANGRTYENSCLAECNEVDYIPGECPVYGIGEVQFSGDSLCGYYIVIVGTTFVPRELEQEFRVHGITVGLRYRKMQDWITCDDPYKHGQEIVILEIEKIAN